MPLQVLLQVGSPALVALQDEDPHTVAGLSGDEVDPGLIIAGGRRSRRGRATFGQTAKYSQQKQVDSDEDEW